jgi:3-hydroxyacyl-[acyl-carrier-protein] dehydratase
VSIGWFRAHGKKNYMRFTLIDQIVDLQPGVSITTTKSLSLSEDYLRDHFPLFPVMPGVLMLEALYQSSAWLLRYTEGFAYSMVVLDEAKTVKYGGLVRPGQTLRLTSEFQKREDDWASFKTKGVVDANVAVSAKLVLRQFNLADASPDRAATDDYIRRTMRDQFTMLSPSNLLTTS